MLYNGRAITQRFFANLPDKKLRVSSRLLIGRSIMNAMKNARLSNVDEADEMLSNVRIAIKQSESYTYDEALAYWAVTNTALGNPVSSSRANRPANSNKPLFDIQEYETDVATGFNNLLFGVALPATLTNAGLPPGVAISFPGLKALVTSYNQIQGKQRCAAVPHFF